MRKSIKLFLSTSALVVALVTPVFATVEKLPDEVTMIQNGRTALSNDISTLVSFDNQCGPEGKIAMHTIVDISQSDAVRAALSEQENYINYLKAVVGNKIELERIKKGNVAALQDLVKCNASMQPQLNAAIVEYNQAVADLAAANAAIIEAQNTFAAYNNNVASTVSAKGDKDSDTIR